MTSSIGTYGANQMYLFRINQVQNRITQLQVQLSTEKKSQAYSGIARDTNNLINYENQISKANQYLENNSLTETRLKASNTAMEAVENVITEFQKRVLSFSSHENKDEKTVTELQEWAFQAMIEMQSYLNSQFGSGYLFSGGKIAEQPVDIGMSSLKQFQARYDGISTTYPTTREAHLQDITTKTSETGSLMTNAATQTITAANADSFKDFKPGSTITLDGANAGKSFTVRDVSSDGRTLHLSQLKNEISTTTSITINDIAQDAASVGPVDFQTGSDSIIFANGIPAGLSAGSSFKVSGSSNNNGTYVVDTITAGPPDVVTLKNSGLVDDSTLTSVSSKSWYDGDTLTISTRIDDNMSLDVGIYASDPAFEKAMRAFGLIAQGVYGSGGGLEDNLERVSQARWLLNDSLDTATSAGPGPFGDEKSSDLMGIQTQIGVQMSSISTKNDKHKSFIFFLTNQVANIENVDKTEVIARLLDDKTALEASYQALSTVRSLSLLNYLR